MSIIDRYIARSFLSGYFILLGVGTGLYVLTDLLVNIDEFVENQELSSLQTFGMMVDYYGHNLPMYFAQLSGPLIAIAAAFTLGNMLRNNELTALVAAGMPLQRLITPLLACAILLLGVWVFNKEVVIPHYAHKIARHKDDIAGTRTEGVYLVRDVNRAMLTARRLYAQRGELERLQIIVPDERGRARALIDADSATYDAEEQTWRLERGRLLPLETPAGFDQPLRYQPIAAYPFALAPEQLVLQQRSEWASLLSLREMNALVQSGDLPNLAKIIVQRHARLTAPLLFLVLLLLVLPFFLTREPGNVLAAGGRALVLSAVFLGLAFVANGIVSQDGAALRAWAPLLCFGPLAIMQISNIKT